MPGPDKQKLFLQRIRTKEALPRFRYANTKQEQAINYVFAFPFKRTPHWFVVHPEQGWFTNMTDEDFLDQFTVSNRMSRDTVASIAPRLAAHTNVLALNKPMLHTVEDALKTKEEAVAEIVAADNGPLKPWSK